MQFSFCICVWWYVVKFSSISTITLYWSFPEFLISSNSNPLLLLYIHSLEYHFFWFCLILISTRLHLLLLEGDFAQRFYSYSCSLRHLLTKLASRQVPLPKQHCGNLGILVLRNTNCVPLTWLSWDCKLCRVPSEWRKTCVLEFYDKAYDGCIILLTARLQGWKLLLRSLLIWNMVFNKCLNQCKSITFPFFDISSFLCHLSVYEHTHFRYYINYSLLFPLEN